MTIVNQTLTFPGKNESLALLFAASPRTWLSARQIALRAGRDHSCSTSVLTTLTRDQYLERKPGRCPITRRSCYLYRLTPGALTRAKAAP